jgi:hypothetical protein
MSKLSCNLISEDIIKKGAFPRRNGTSDQLRSDVVYFSLPFEVFVCHESEGKNIDWHGAYMML